MSEYTPSLDEEIESIAVAMFEKSHEASCTDDSLGMNEARRFVSQSVTPLIEAVRAEEREKADRIAESVSTYGWGGLRAKELIAARIREQGKEQGS